MKNVAKLLVGIILTASAMTAFAADEGFFVEGNIGTNVISARGNGVEVVADSGVGVNGNAGYQFNRYFALEGGYTVHHDDSATLHTLHAAGKATLPLGERAKLFAKLGVADVIYESSDTEVGPFAGLGFAYAMNDRLDLNVQSQVTYLSDYDATLGLLSTGITYHFG